MTIADAERVAGWRYREQWSVYDLSSSASVVEELDLYWAVIDVATDQLVGFICVDAAARIPGLSAEWPFVDVGVGMDPGLVGQGRGVAFGGAVLNHMMHRYPGQPMRAVIQAWNKRSLRFAARQGFIDVGEVVGPEDGLHGGYRVLVMPNIAPPRKMPPG